MTAAGGAVGLIGLGNMGAAIGRRLLDVGWQVFARDIDTRLIARFVAHGGDALDRSSIADLDVVVLLLPDSGVVEQIAPGRPGRPGLLDELRPGSTVIDMGSSSPASTRSLAAEVDRSGLHWFDAALSGGVARARAGSLTVMAGGTEELVNRHRPLLKSIGSSVVRVGPVGSGHAMKALNNLLSATSLLATSEAIAAGRRAGIAPDTMIDILNSSTGESYSTRVKFPQHILNEQYDSGFALSLMVKDLAIANELTATSDADHGIARAVLQNWVKAAALLPSDADHTRVAATFDDHHAEGGR